MEADQPRWVGVQHRTFTVWCNHALRSRGVKMAELPEGLKDGVNLCYLVEELTGRNLPARYSKTPKSRFEKLQNASAAINALKADGVPLVAIGPEDVVDPKLKLNLGLVWMLILHYQIQGAGGGGGAGGKGKKQNASGAKRELLEWVKDRLKDHPNVNVNNFTSSWQDGVVLSALVDSFNPGVFDIDALSETASDHDLWLTTTVNAVNKANDLGVPPMINAEDLVNNPDELAIMTYVSAFRQLADGTPYGCFLTGKGIERPVLGETNDFTISLFKKDDKSPVKLGNNELEDALEIAAMSPAGDMEFLTARSNGDGTYATAFNPQTPGEYEIAVRLHGHFLKGAGHVKVPDNKPIARSAAPAAAAAAPSGGASGAPAGAAASAAPAAASAPTADGASSTAEGDGLTKGSTTKPATFVVQARDKAGEPVKVSGADVTVDVTPASGAAPANEDDAPFAQVYDEGDGTYSVMYFTPIAGDFKLDVKLDGVPIKNSPFSTKIRTAPDASQCTIRFPNKDSVVVGKPETIIIEAKDASGAPLKEGGDEFRVNFETGGADTVETTQTDNGDGTYTQTFTCPVAGKYSVDVRIGDESVSGAPIAFDVRKGLPSAAHSTAEGPGLERAWTFRPNKFTVTTRDADGNPIQIERGAEYTVDVAGPAGNVPVKVSDHGDGTYAVQYKPEKDGEHAVNVKVGGAHIKGSPFKVGSEQLVSAANSVVEGEGVTKLTTGKPSVFTIRSMDKTGKPVKEGGDDWQVEVKSPQGAAIPKRVRDNRDGTYTVRYVPPKTGEYIVTPTLYGQPIKGAPFYVNADRSKDFAAFSFTSLDGEGKGIVDTVRKFDVAVTGPKGDEVEFATADIDEGTYGVDFRPSQGPGTYKIAVKLDGEHIANSPFSVKVGGDDESGQPPVKFPFIPKDQAGNQIKPKRIVEFAVKVTGPDDKECKSELFDSGDGGYGVVFKPNIKGLHKISVDHNGAPIQGSVFLVNVGGGPVPGAGAPGGAPAGPQPVRFPFNPQDTAGSPIKGAAASDFEIKVAGPDGVPLKAEVTGTEGSFGVVFTPGPPGIHTVEIKNKGNHIKGSIFRLNIGGAAAPAAGAGAKAGGAPAAGAGGAPAAGAGAAAGAGGAPPAGQRNLVRFRIPAKKKDGSPITFKSVDEFTVSISGPRGDNEKSVQPREVQDNKDGAIAVIFDPEPGPGIYKISATHSGEEVEKAPFLINVGGAPAAAAGAGAGAGAGAAPAAARAAAAPAGPKYDAQGKPIWDPIPGRSFAKFPFTPLSAAGQPIADVSQLELVLTAPDGKEVAGKIQPEGAAYVVVFQPIIPGDYKIALAYNKEAIQGSPFTVEVGGKQDMFGSSEAKFKITAPKERGSGQPIPSSTPASEFTVSVTLNDARVEARLVSNGDGSYDIVFKPTGPGTYALSVQYKGAEIDGSPYRINIGDQRGDGKALPAVSGERSQN
eukprot:TRINITY_DN529_c0_g1_i1.p1 TRINITY_DN529_c0_g1~~TRINITY_DN529_c0_g1_i1.p1  ORF type:complete len:1445 (+),score=313.33 TRINITY_DN529_c0_g1_i1:188-4522(+)